MNTGLSLRLQIGRQIQQVHDLLGIKQLGITFRSFFLLKFPHENSQQATFKVANGNPCPPALNDSPAYLCEHK